MKAGISQYVRRWESHIRGKKQRYEERSREERQSSEHGDDDSAMSGDDDVDKGGRTGGKEVEKQQQKQRDGGKGTQDTVEMRGGHSVGADESEVVKPAIKGRFRRELAALDSALAFSSDVQVTRKMQGRSSAVVNELDARRYVPHKKPDLQTPHLYTIDVPAATLFTDKDGKSLQQPGDRQPVHARRDESSDEGAQSHDRDGDKGLLRAKREVVTWADEKDGEHGNHDAQTMKDAMDALETDDEGEKIMPGAEKAGTSIQVNGCVMPHALISRMPAMTAVVNNKKDERSVRAERHLIEDANAHAVYTSHHALGTEGYVEVTPAHDSERKGQQQAKEEPALISVDGITLFIQRKECWTHAKPASALVVKPAAAAVVEHAAAPTMEARTQHSTEPNSMLQCTDVVTPAAEPAAASTAEPAATVMEHVMTPTVEPAAVPTADPAAVPAEGRVPVLAAEPAVATTVRPAAVQTDESGAVKKARTHTEEDERKLKKMRIEGVDDEQHMEREGYVTADERRSVMAKLFSEERDDTQAPMGVPHPYAGCNNSNTQHSAGSLDALLNASDDEYDDIL
jgi:hypothetical protein